MAKGLIDMFIDSIFDEQWVGRHGEKLTEQELKFVKLFGRKGKILRNVYLPKDNGETSEIDVLYITQKGIFVFESKNYSGWIFGDEKGQYWTLRAKTIPGGSLAMRRGSTGPQCCPTVKRTDSTIPSSKIEPILNGCKSMWVRTSHCSRLSFFLNDVN